MFTNDTWCCLSLNNNIIVSYENGQYYWALYAKHFSDRVFSLWEVAITIIPTFQTRTLWLVEMYNFPSHRAWDGVPIQAYVLSRLHSQRLPAFYYGFFQQLGEENKIGIVSNLQLGKLELRDVKLGQVSQVFNVQFSTFSSSLLLSCTPVVLSFSPWPSRASLVLLVWCPAHLRKDFYLSYSWNKIGKDFWKAKVNSYLLPTPHQHMHPSPRGDRAESLHSESQGADLPETGKQVLSLV